MRLFRPDVCGDVETNVDKLRRKVDWSFMRSGTQERERERDLYFLFIYSWIRQRELNFWEGSGIPHIGFKKMCDIEKFSLK